MHYSVDNKGIAVVVGKASGQMYCNVLPYISPGGSINVKILINEVF
jgi:hypothetical protein